MNIQAKFQDLRYAEGFFATPLGKLIAETLRWAVLGAVSLFITGMLQAIPEAGLDPNTAFYLTAILRFIDNALHKSGVYEPGITRF